MMWMFRQRGKRTNHYENTVIKDAFADYEWDGRKNTLKRSIENWHNPSQPEHMEAFERLVEEWNLANRK